MLLGLHQDWKAALNRFKIQFEYGASSEHWNQCQHIIGCSAIYAPNFVLNS